MIDDKQWAKKLQNEISCPGYLIKLGSRHIMWLHRSFPKSSWPYNAANFTPHRCHAPNVLAAIQFYPSRWCFSSPMHRCANACNVTGFHVLPDVTGVGHLNNAVVLTTGQHSCTFPFMSSVWQLICNSDCILGHEIYPSPRLTMIQIIIAPTTRYTHNLFISIKH
jgi:hypothetical protein